MKSFITLLAVFCVLGQLRAQTPEDMLMLSSPAELKQYALSQVAAGESWVWGEAITASIGSIQYISINGDVDDVLNGFVQPNNQFLFNVRDTNQPVHVYTSLLNKNGEGLFSDFTSVLPVNGPGGLTINPTAKMKMVPTIPVEFASATYASIFYEDENGNKWQQNLNVRNNKIYFPVEYAGRGTLVVGRQYPQNGAIGYSLEIAYDLSTGTVIQSETVFGQTQYAGVENYIGLSDEFAPQTGVLAFVTSMAPPAKDTWNFVSPPTGSIKLVSTPEGTNRTCRLVISFRCTIAELGTTEALIYDPKTVDSEGFVTEYPGMITKSQIQTPDGPQTTLTITWTVTRSGPDVAKWQWRIESEGFNNQKKPQPPYYGGVDKG